MRVELHEDYDDALEKHSQNDNEVRPIGSHKGGTTLIRIVDENCGFYTPDGKYWRADELMPFVYAYIDVEIVNGGVEVSYPYTDFWLADGATHGECRYKLKLYELMAIKEA